MRDVVAFMGTQGLSLRTLADAQRVKRVASELSQRSFLTDQHVKVSDTQCRIGLDVTSSGDSVSYLEIDTDDDGRIQSGLLTFSQRMDDNTNEKAPSIGQGCHGSLSLVRDQIVTAMD